MEKKQEEVKERYIIEYESRDGQEIKLSFETVAKYLVQGTGTVTKQEMMFFLGVCKSRGLNPFKKDAYLIKYGGDPAAIVTSIDYFRSRARAQKDCTGWKKGVIVQMEDGTVKDSAGLILEGEKLVGGFFEATPHGWKEPFRIEVNLNSFVKKTKTGAITRFWSEPNQPMMIAKVAESQGLRTLWPDEFQGMYEKDEIQPSDVTMTKVNGEYRADDLSEKIAKQNNDHEKCPWPDCNTMTTPKGLTRHINSAHNGEYPIKDTEPMEDTQETKIVTPAPNGFVSNDVLREEAEEMASRHRKNLEIIFDFRQSVKDESYKRLGMDANPYLSKLSYEAVQEILDMCHVVNNEIPDESDEEQY